MEIYLAEDTFAVTQNKQEYAYTTLKEMIVENRIPADTNLVERQLCDMLKLSRTPIRAALQELEKDGLVEYYPGRGVVVSRIQLEDLVEIFELRGSLDILALSLLMRTDYEDTAALMRKAVDDMRMYYEKGDYISCARCDNEFHECYFFNTGNKRLDKIMSMISDHVRRILNLTSADKERCAMACKAHEGIMKAIDAGDVERATNLLAEHLDDSLDYHIKKATRR